MKWLDNTALVIVIIGAVNWLCLSESSNLIWWRSFLEI